jgi:hypothetical protein
MRFWARSRLPSIRFSFAAQLGPIAITTDTAVLQGLRHNTASLNRARLGLDQPTRRYRTLVALDVADIEIVDAGLRVIIRRSKTDQESEGVTIAIARGSVACPVVALREWLSAAEIREGPSSGPSTRPALSCRPGYRIDQWPIS